MSYSFNSFTGRLIGTTQLKAYNPQGLKKLGPSEPVNPYPPTWKAVEARAYTHHGVDHPTPKSAPHSATPRLAPSGIPYGPVPEHFRRAQEHFQKPNNVLVHLKGGPKDKIIYYFTMGLIAVGLVGILHADYKLSFPRKE